MLSERSAPMRLIAPLLIALGAAGPVLAAPSLGALPPPSFKALSAPLADMSLDQVVQAPLPQDPAERFLRAGAHFLRGTEIVLQARYQVGLTDTVAMFPFLRQPLPRADAPRPMPAGLVGKTLEAALREFAAARDILDGLPQGAEFKASVDLSHLWFDIDASGTRGNGESLAEVVTSLGAMPHGEGAVIAFDNADAAWLDAYAALLSGVSQAVLSRKPDTEVDAVLEARRHFLANRTGVTMDGMIPDGALDAAGMVLGALGQDPDASRSRAARKLFLDVIASNRVFWDLAFRETDDDREWLPNPNQSPVLGATILAQFGEGGSASAAAEDEAPAAPTLPPQTRAAWEAVLDSAEDLLEGRALLPFWRSAEGINLARLFDQPAPVRLDEWIQGRGVVPYLEKGRLADMQSLQEFSELFPGSAGLMAVWLN